MVLRLLEVDNGKWVIIERVEGGRSLVTSLRQHGLFPGDRIRVLRTAPLGGPLLVEINQREVALGRGVAAKVICRSDCQPDRVE
jgi:ferrous iron transport protein A